MAALASVVASAITAHNTQKVDDLYTQLANISQKSAELKGEDDIHSGPVTSKDGLDEYSEEIYDLRGEIIPSCSQTTL